MNAQQPPKSFCLVRLSALGDVIMVLPLVRLLQASYPGCRITWIIGKGLVHTVAHLEEEGVELVAIDKPRGLGDYLAIRRRLAGREFDALFCLQASWRANWIYPCIRAKRKIGYGTDRAKDLHRFFIRESLPPAKPHIVDGFFQFAERLGTKPPAVAAFGLRVSEEAKQWAKHTLPAIPYVAISPCASKAERDWPVDRYAAVASYLHQQKIPIVLLGGKSARELALAGQLQAMAGVPLLDLVGKTSLDQLFACLAGCRALLAPDTGAVHIANAFGRPVVGLYAVAPARRTGPYGHLEHSVDVFDEAVKTLLKRDPQGLRWSQRVHHPKAMELISVSAVLAKFKILLNNS